MIIFDEMMAKGSFVSILSIAVLLLATVLGQVQGREEHSRNYHGAYFADENMALRSDY